MSGDPFQAEPSVPAARTAARTAPRNPPLTDTLPAVVSEDESNGVLTSADRGRDARQEAKGARLRVVVVGQGPPTRGGIPSFISMLLEDPWLGGRVDLHHLNTTPARAKRPGAFALANITSAMSQGLAVFKSARRADVVHLNLAPVPLLPLIRAGVLVWAGRAAGCRVVLHAHTGRLPAAVRSWKYRAVLRAVAAGVDTLVVVSKEAEIAASRCCRNVTLLPNAVDIREFKTADPSSPPVRLVFVGTVCERKGLLDLRDALLLLKDKHDDAMEVTIVGDGAQEGPGAWESISGAYARSGLSHVSFLGAVDRDRVRELLQRSSIFCLPSHWEGSPLSVLEAMASGLAIVATRVGEVPEMLAGGDAGILIDRRDVRALGAALGLLIDDPGRREALGRKARLRAETDYGSQRLMQAIYSIYLSAARRDRPAGPSISGVDEMATTIR